jgi:hypothetical protein
VTGGTGIPAGSLLAHFRVEERIGEGALGVVYRAYDQKLKRLVALKLLAGAPAPASRLLEEARSAAGLNHPSIAAIYEVQQHESVAFIVMELVEGATLRRVLEPGALDVSIALSHARAIAAGLARAHKSGVVHRDLKPENVMVASPPDSGVKILDFGLARDVTHAGGSLERRAKVHSGMGGETGVAGTPSYMSPEQARGNRVDARSDVFSFGVVLYEMLSGERPFARRSESDPKTWGPDAWTMVARLEAKAPRTPPELVRVVETCLALDPAARYLDGSAISAALGPIAAQAESPRPRRRWPLVIGAWSMAVVAIAAAAGRARSNVANAETPLRDGERARDAHEASLSASADARAAYVAGLDAWRDGDTKRAKASFGEAVARDPEFAEGWLRLAGLHRATGDHAAARDALAHITNPHTRLGAQDRVLFESYEALARADQCHAANDLLPDGTPCDDDNACTQEDACQAGTCVGAKALGFAGHWTGTDGTGSADVTQTEGHLLGVWASGTRPNFVGTVTASRSTCSASVVFPDHRTYVATLKGNGCSIDWDNDTTWLRAGCP